MKITSHVSPAAPVGVTALMTLCLTSINEVTRYSDAALLIIALDASGNGVPRPCMQHSAPSCSENAIEMKYLANCRSYP